MQQSTSQYWKLEHDAHFNKEETVMLPSESIHHITCVMKKLLTLLFLSFLIAAKTMGQTGPAIQTWYSFSTGNWSDAANWTLDASATPQYVNPNSEIPDANDTIIVNSGRTITLDINNIEVQSVEINGIIDLADATGTNFNIIKGSGVILMDGASGVDNFPSGKATGSGNFADATDGGTLRVTGSIISLNQNRELNNVMIILDDPNDIATLSADYTLNGELIVSNGNLQFESSTARNLTVNGDVTVETNGSITVANGNARHQFNMNGNFTNNGTVRFTNRDETVANYADPDNNGNESDSYYTNEATDGIVDANFLNPSEDQTILCAGLTAFYRIEINKGTDATYQLDLTATASTNFYLLGFANETHGSTSTDHQLTTNDNAFGLVYGTVRIESNVDILHINTNGNYNISEGAAIWVDGGTLTKEKATGAIAVYGLLKITDGTINSLVNTGITMRNDGLLNVEGGTINTYYVRCSDLDVNDVGGYIQSGGTVHIDASSSSSSNTAAFDLPYTSNTFAMSGGTLHIQSPNGDGEGLLINSDLGNQNVTGGTVIMEIDSGISTDFDFSSRAPFYNLMIRNNSGSTSTTHELTSVTSDVGPITLAPQPLVVLNDLTIESGAFLNLNSTDINIGRNLTIEDNIRNESLNTGTNTITFDGSEDGTISITSTDSDYLVGQLEVNGLSVNKSSSSNGIFVTESSPASQNEMLLIAGNISVEKGYINQGNVDPTVTSDTITVKSTGVLGVYGGSGSGEFGQWAINSIPLTIITENGAQFGYIRPNTTSTINLTSDVYIQRLYWLRGLWNLSTHNLKIDQLDIRISSGEEYEDVSGATVCSQCLNVTQMFATAGNASDGGLTLMVQADGINDGQIWGLDHGGDLRDYQGNVVTNTSGGNAGDNLFIFPVGIGTSGEDINFHNDSGPSGGTSSADSSKYTPLYLSIEDMTGVTEDSVYVTVRPVDVALQTTNLSGGDLMSYYWRIDHEYTGTVPVVSLQTTYYDDDLDGSSNESSFVAGKVENGGSYIRSGEDFLDANGDGDVVDSGDTNHSDEFIDGMENTITYNGLTDTGFNLENVNYTAGEKSRFVGAPTIYYNRDTGGKLPWTDPTKWSTTSHFGSAASTYPVAGDIVYISNPGNNGAARVEVTTGTTVSAAVIEFNNDAGPASSWGNRISINLNTTVNFSEVRGNYGELKFSLSTNSADAAQFNGDIGNFAQSTVGARVVYQASTSSSTTPSTSRYEVLPIFPEYPQIKFSGSTLYNSSAIHANGWIWVANNCRLVAEADITSEEYIRVSHSNDYFSQLRFGSGVAGVTIGCDYLQIGGGSTASGVDAFVDVVGAPSSGTHKLTVNKQIEFRNAGGRSVNAYLDLYNSPTAYAELELVSENDGYLSKLASTNTVDLHSIRLNKGADTTYSFTFDESFSIPTPSTISAQPIEIVNGKLVLNNPTIDITLTDATQGDFQLPNTDHADASSGSGGLELAAGTLRIGGDDTGVILDGLLRISGGTFTLEDGTNNGNNFIEYSASGNALLDVSGGSLIVGSQVRRSTFSQAGILKYRQTGGTVAIGRNDFTPEADRGVFEVLNAGSEFTHTGGSFTLERSNGSTTVASLLLEPETFNFDTGSTITLGSVNTPVSTTFGIQIAEYTSTIETSNASGNNPTIAQYNTGLHIDGELIIGSGTTFDASGRDLTIRGNHIADGNAVFQNNGTFIANSNATTFDVSDTKTISGNVSTVFYDFIHAGSGTLQLTTHASATNDLTLNAGTFNTLSNTFSVLGDVFNDATHASTGGEGIKLEGTTVQTIQSTASGSSIFGILSINNSNGVNVLGNDYEFTIDNKLVLENGVLNIGGNLLTLAATATAIENGSGGTTVDDFSISNMIQTNSSIKDFGVKKLVNSGAGTYVFPVGQQTYTPVQINAATLTSSGGHFLVRPVNDQPLGILDDSEPNGGSCGDPEIVDFDHVLDYYWIIKSENITNFNTANAAGDGVLLYYDASNLPTPVSPYTNANYGPAKLLTASSNWDKAPLFADDFNEVTQEITFHFSNSDAAEITGIYTAGITLENDGMTPLCGGGAIPATVSEYVTMSSGEDEFDETTYGVTWTNNGGSTVPSGGPFGADIVIKSGFTLVLNDNAVRLRKTTIESGAILKNIEHRQPQPWLCRRRRSNRDCGEWFGCQIAHRRL